ncbi:MAG: hypothetical protein WBX25_30100, partial [Rhodomicrobium sp.]
RGLKDKALVLVGSEDEAVDGAALQPLIASEAAGSQVKILPGVNHFGVFTEPKALDEIVAWLQSTPHG